MPRDETNERPNTETGERAEQAFRFADDLGPAKIVQADEPSTGLKAIVVAQGFGSAGRRAAHFPAAKGAALRGMTDSKAAPHQPKGIDIAEPIAIEDQGARPPSGSPSVHVPDPGRTKKSRSQEAGGKV